MSKSSWFPLALTCIFIMCAARAEDAAPAKLTPAQRLEPAHLKAAHDARLEFQKNYKTTHIPFHGLYDDYRTVLNVHASDLASREMALKAAKKCGVQAVMFTGARDPKLDEIDRRYERDGVLSFNGTEDANGGLRIALFPENATGFHWGESRFQAIHDEQTNLAASTGLQLTAGAEQNKALRACVESSCKTPEGMAAIRRSFESDADAFYACCTDYPAATMALWDRDMTAGRATPLFGIGANVARQELMLNGILFDPYELNFRNMSTHVLVPELNETEVRKALRTGHCYVAHDWLCDPTGFAFASINNFGLFPMGDSAPFLMGMTRIVAYTPIPAHLKLIHNGEVVRDQTGTNMTFEVKEGGSYRLEAWLTVDGEERPWIYSNPIFIEALSLGTLDTLRTPSFDLASNVAAVKNIAYTAGKPEDEEKHKLDLFIPKDKKKLPVFFFIHGGAWKEGDRSYYLPVANRFAKEGILTVLPSYRLSSKYKHPAHIEDVAAAFAWVVRHIEEYGGDPERIYIGGHSAGGHLAALLALDGKYLDAQKISRKSIRGAACLSGVYNLSIIGENLTFAFGNDKAVWKDASPLFHVPDGQQPGQETPPFLITYCQWDYPTLPGQAKEFHAALKKSGGAPQLLYVLEENHISEMLSIVREKDPVAAAILKFINNPRAGAQK